MNGIRIKIRDNYDEIELWMNKNVMDKNYEVLCVSQVSCLIVGVVCPFNFIEDAD